METLTADNIEKLAQRNIKQGHVYMYFCIFVYSYGHHLAAQVMGKRERHSLPMFELGYKSRRRASEVDKITFKFSFAVPRPIIALPCQSVSRLVEFCSNC